mmetsp:Transcript_23685/g.54706  ORF Transcript_23685/g.54706 Transcript_23685/m.54706 type:complete len:238 (-) Transcript_23685:862-1575(-)
MMRTLFDARFGIRDSLPVGCCIRILDHKLFHGSAFRFKASKLPLYLEIPCCCKKALSRSLAATSTAACKFDSGKAIDNVSASNRFSSFSLAGSESSSRAKGTAASSSPRSSNIPRRSSASKAFTLALSSSAATKRPGPTLCRQRLISRSLLRAVGLPIPTSPKLRAFEKTAASKDCTFWSACKAHRSSDSNSSSAGDLSAEFRETSSRFATCDCTGGASLSTPRTCLGYTPLLCRVS